MKIVWDHSFSTLAKFSEKSTFGTPETHTYVFSNPVSLSMEFIMNSKRELELITSPISGCQICLVVFLESDALNLNEVFDLFQKLRLVIHASYCMTSLFCFQIPRKSVI